MEPGKASPPPLKLFLTNMEAGGDRGWNDTGEMVYLPVRICPSPLYWADDFWSSLTQEYDKSLLLPADVPWRGRDLYL